MHITVVDMTSSLPIYHGDFADTFRAEYRGRPVAIKSFRIHSSSNFEAISGVSASVFVFRSDVCS